MNQPIKRTYEAQIIGGIFTPDENADQAIEAWVVRLDDQQATEAYTAAVVKAIRSGNILVPVDHGSHPAPVIEAFNDPEDQQSRLVLVEWPQWLAQVDVPTQATPEPPQDLADPVLVS